VRVLLTLKCSLSLILCGSVEGFGGNISLLVAFVHSHDLSYHDLLLR
jgi:hypothetical protein